jgi:hypothetical protein
MGFANPRDTAAYQVLLLHAACYREYRWMYERGAVQCECFLPNGTCKRGKQQVYPTQEQAFARSWRTIEEKGQIACTCVDESFLCTIKPENACEGICFLFVLYVLFSLVSLLTLVLECKPIEMGDCLVKGLAELYLCSRFRRKRKLSQVCQDQINAFLSAQHWDISQGRGGCDAALQVDVSVDEHLVGTEGKNMLIKRMQGDDYCKQKLERVSPLLQLDCCPWNWREKGFQSHPKLFCFCL